MYPRFVRSERLLLGTARIDGRNDVLPRAQCTARDGRPAHDHGPVTHQTQSSAFHSRLKNELLCVT
jgi:hypothetical protein